MPLLHEEHAKTLLERHAIHEEAPASRKARVHMWTAVGVCAAVFVAAYYFVAVRTYDFPGVQESFANAVVEVKGMAEKVSPEVEKSKMFWNALKLNLTKEANAQMEAKVVEEMKKQLEYGRAEEIN